LAYVERGRQVLVVDDDEGVRTAVTWALEADGFEVLAVEDGLAAVDVIETAPLSLVVLDLSLPGLGGLDILSRVRTSEARDGRWRLPIIVLSGRNSEMDRIVGLDLGADDYLVKPFSPGELAARARSVLRRCARPTAGGTQAFTPAGSGVEIDRKSRDV
jgi:two-component system, OmpR family, phosphate regulon response regulator PhoB